VIVTNPSLLITDDDREFRESLREVFEPQGYRTVLAGDGEEAIQILHRERIHVALIDMHMPRLSGLETVQRVRETRLEIPCILISAAMDDALAEAARQVQVFASLSKPVDVGHVRKLVRDALRISYNWLKN
jgi:two-component system chemotaxis response regulator CheY